MVSVTESTALHAGYLLVLDAKSARLRVLEALRRDDRAAVAHALRALGYSI